MNQKNIKFKIGDTVIALKSSTEGSAQIRVKGNKYPVTGVIFCSACGCQMINIENQRYIQLEYTQCPCKRHGSVFKHNTIAYTTSKYFIKPEDLPLYVKFLAEEKEDYDEAIFFRDLEKKLEV